MRLSPPRFLALFLVLLLTGLPAAAQDMDVEPDTETEAEAQPQKDAGTGAKPERPPRLKIELGAMALNYDNFLVKEGEPLDVWALRLDGRFPLMLDRKGRLSTYLAVSQWNYDAFAPSNRLQIGLDYRGRRHAADGYARYDFDVPSNYVGDQLDTGNLKQIAGRYGYRFKRHYQVRFSLTYYEERFQIFTPKDNDTWEGGVSFRYRRWRVLSPEIGFSLRRQDARNDNYDYTQRAVFLKIRSVPADSLYISFRFRYRDRKYGTGDDDDSNFGRKDDQDQFQLVLLWRMKPWVALDAYASQESVDSLKPGSSRQGTVAGLGFRFRF